MRQRCLGEKTEQEGNQHTTLRGGGHIVHGDAAGRSLAHLYCLLLLRAETEDPVAEASARVK